MKLIRFLIPLALGATMLAETPRWSVERANEWYARQPWLVGANYTPASAINELEMWQADTFDARRIDTELGWAEDLGMNTMRVFLHDLLWQQDAAGFRNRMERFLEIAARHHIRPMFVLFDSCWDPRPQLGKQRDPKPGVHNSGWMQSPGAEALRDPSQQARLAAYVKGVVGAFANDQRILAWDIWNEPDNLNGSSYGKLEPPDKAALVLALLPRAFEWARSANPSQPLTSGIWQGDWSADDKLSPMARTQLELSDVISFHNYDAPAEFEKRVEWLRRYQRPLVCTEYMARGNGSTFHGTLPVAKKHRVAVFNWGFAAGKTQTNLPWDSWKRPYTDREPPVWFHEIFYADGRPYRTEEVWLIRQFTGRLDKTLANPLLPSGPDPWVVQKDGHYYYMHTTGANLTIWKTGDIADLARAEKKVVWTPPASGPYSHDIWAPELHFLQGRWYIYFAADAGANESHRLWVLENASADPLAGEWVMKGKVADPSDKWAIDGTVLEHGGRLYLIWSGWDGDTNRAQNIYIAEMQNPWTIKGRRVPLSRPEYPWEKVGDINHQRNMEVNPGLGDDPLHVDVNEGPATLVHDGRIFIVYSASGCWTDSYALGMLSAPASANLLDAASWKKSEIPVFWQSPAAHAFAPGHNSFFKSPDGKQDWILYHANPEANQGCGKSRSPRAQPFGWNPDGTPNFGRPAPATDGVAVSLGK